MMYRDLEREPVEENLQEYWQDCIDLIHRAVSGPSVERFYIGATMNPCQRWSGAEDDVWSRRAAMVGHRESYRAMMLIALLMGSHHSRYVESQLTRVSLE